MCDNPLLLSSGEVPCRNCKQCRRAYVWDWVGRNTAESVTSVTSFFVTLTYGNSYVYGVESEAAASWLDYSHVQKFLKRLRISGTKCRYFVVGEYGTKKGRAHWHALLYFQRKMSCSDAQVLLEKHWGHGFCNVKAFNERSAPYCCKYLQKTTESQEPSVAHMSKQPSLGAAYIMQFARDIARAGLPLHGPYYWISGVIDKKTKKPRRFYLRGHSLDIFCQEYVQEWRSVQSGHIPPAPFLEEYLDKCARADRVEPVVVSPYKFPAARPWLPAPNQYTVRLDRALGWVADHPSLPRLYWSFDNLGVRAWDGVIRTEDQADALRLLSEIRSSKRAYLDLSKGR